MTGKVGSWLTCSEEADGLDLAEGSIDRYENFHPSLCLIMLLVLPLVLSQIKAS